MLNASQKCVNKNSLTWWYVLKTSWRHLSKTFWRCLEHVLKKSSKRFEDVSKMSWRRFEDDLKTSWRVFKSLEEVWPRQIYLSWSRRLEGVFWRHMSKANMLVLIKTSWKCLEYVFWRWRRKTSSRRLHQDECLLCRIVQYHQKILKKWINVPFQTTS